MESKCGCKCDPKSAAVALGRWSLGMMLLMAGIGKLTNLTGFVENVLRPIFANNWIPKWLLVPYGYALPFVEVGLGVLLLLGYRRNGALFGTGLLFLTLVFGQLALGNWVVVAQNTLYLFMSAALLFLHEHDTWLCCKKTGADVPVRSQPV